MHHALWCILNQPLFVNLACGLPQLLHRMLLLHFGLFVAAAAAAAAAADLLMLGQEDAPLQIAGLSCRLNSRTLPYRPPTIKSG